MGILISFEGIDGAGKSTQVRLLADHLKECGISSVICYEPGGTEIGDSIREILLNPEYKHMSPLTELLLFYASRCQLLEEVVIPALNQDKVILLDRFIDSTYAYQGYGRGIDLNTISLLNKLILRGIRPDRTFLLDISVEEALRRKKKHDRFDEESVDFLKKVRSGYREIAEAEPDRIKIIDAKKPVLEIAKEILEALEELWH